MKLPKSSRKPKRPKLLIVRQVSGDSMLPTLRPRCIIIGTGRYGGLQPGDIVVVRHGGLEKVKRIQQVRNDHLFLAGDNEGHSTDSRTFGWLHISVVVAKVVWPARPASTSIQTSEPKTLVRTFHNKTGKDI